MNNIRCSTDLRGRKLYCIEIKVPSNANQVYNWMVESFGGLENGGYSYYLKDQEWAFYLTTIGTIQVKFRNEAYANWFLLRWS